MQAGAWAVLALCGVVPTDEAAADAAVRRFEDEFYRLGAREDARLSALQALGARKHPKTVRALAPVLTRSPLSARILAARILSRFEGVEGTPAALLSALRASANQGAKTSAVRIEILRSLGALKAAEAESDVNRLVEDREAWVAKAAIDAAGRLRQKSSVDPLLKALRRLEGPDANAEVGLDPIGIELGDVSPQRMLEGAFRSDRKVTQRDFLREPLLAALRAITGETHATPKAWTQWWSKAKGSFRVSDY
jgi:HEAT repeat protein